jgi:lipopolysaccharide transport system ATP-binding protein
MMTPAIKVEQLSKRYRIGQRVASSDTFSGVVGGMLRAPLANLRALRRLSHFQEDDTANEADVIWPLRDVSFDVQQGEAVGVIGANGAGKSTLLKVISRITWPTSGRVRVRGRVASLLEVGTGFHPEMTGRENIYMNGTILGMRKREIDRRLEEIIEFSGVEKFLDTPVKRYSSGMKVRLAFSVAAHLEPEVLIIDEVLAVGDASFQKRCLGKMGDVTRAGRTVLFVSHNLRPVQYLTNRCVYLKEGRVAAFDTTQKVIDQYLADAAAGESNLIDKLDAYRHRPPDAEISGLIRAIWVNEHNDAVEPPEVELGEELTLSTTVDVQRPIPQAYLNVALRKSDADYALVHSSLDSNFSFAANPGTYSIRIRLGDLHLAPGNYALTFSLNERRETAEVPLDIVLDVPLVTIVNRGAVTHWIDRPWGHIYSDKLAWEIVEEQTHATSCA